MLKRFAVLMSFALLMLFAAATVEAKTISIAYGDLVEGEITADQTEVEYSLTVAKGDVVVLDMRRSKDSELYSTAVIVQDEEGNEVVNTTEDTSANNTVAGFIAESDGDYTVIATRNKYSQTFGEFQLRPTSVKLLESGDSVKGLVNNKTADVYYALPADTDVKISYTQTAGDYYLYFRIMVLDSQTSGTISASSTAIHGITWTVGMTTESKYLTLVSVGGNQYDLQHDDISSKFTLNVE
ncbi:MAG: hypothetical protein GC179_12440 [Anaerolineaceae bacterium]|nr:hypothetical protein [Anaerolineaceae bacterium]